MSRARDNANLGAQAGSGLDASDITSGALPVGVTGGSGLNALSASNLSAGTIPDARFPATLPAASGVNLTATNASNLGSGTVPDARFPATLPATNGANITDLSAADVTGVLPSTVTGGQGLTLAGTVGMIAAFGVASAPLGWIYCDGAQPLRAGTYAALFGVIGTTWGAGNGSSTFHLPDLRGVFLRGVGTHGSISYSAGGSITASQSAKSGSLALTGSTGTSSGSNGTIYTGSGSQKVTSGYYSGSDVYYSNMTFSFTGTDSYPSNIAVYNCIKF